MDDILGPSIPNEQINPEIVQSSRHKRTLRSADGFSGVKVYNCMRLVIDELVYWTFVSVQHYEPANSSDYFWL